MVTIGPLPSSGLPSGSTTRPSTASPTGTLSSRPVLLTSSPSLILQVVAQNDHAHRVLFQVEGQADDAAGELDHFAGHDARQAVDARNAVAHFEHATDFADVDLGLEVFQFPAWMTEAISSALNFMNAPVDHLLTRVACNWWATEPS